MDAEPWVTINIAGKRMVIPPKMLAISIQKKTIFHETNYDLFHITMAGKWISSL